MTIPKSIFVSLHTSGSHDIKCRQETISASFVIKSGSRIFFEIVLSYPDSDSHKEQCFWPHI